MNMTRIDGGEGWNLYQIGTQLRPATPEDIRDVQEQLARTALNPNMAITWGHHHDFSMLPAAPLSPSTPRPKHHFGFNPKKVFIKHVANGHMPGMNGVINQNNKTLSQKPTMPPAVLKSFEGTVHGRMEVME